MNTSPVLIEADGFRLRQLEASDWPWVVKVGRTDIPDWTYFPKSADEAAAKAWLHQDLEARDRGVAVRFMIEVDGEPAGLVGGRHDPPGDPGTVEVYYCILPDYRRRGLATASVKAFEAWVEDAVPNLRRLQLHVIVGNPGSVDVARRAGYRHEGTLRLRIPPINGHPARDADLFAKTVGGVPPVGAPPTA